jgi:hypothetical protein
MYAYKFAEIGTHITAIERDAGKLQDKIHAVAFACFRGWWKGEDGSTVADYITRLSKASPYHGKAFATWVSAMTPLAWSDESEAFYVPVDKETDEPVEMTAETLQIIKDTPFFKFRPASKAKPMDFLDTIEELKDKLQKRAEKPKPGDVVDLIAVKELADLVARAKERIEQEA